MPGSSAGHLMGIELEVGLIVVAITVTITVTIVFHMIHGAAIAFFEAFAEFAAIMFVDGRMFVHLVIVGVGVAAVHIVPACSFDTLAKSLALRVAVAVGGAIPVAIAVLILVLVLC
jgi:hypothetical protein